MSGNIHPSAVIAEGAIIDAEARIGPFCVVGSHASIGPGCELISHVCVDGHTRLGANNKVFPFVSLGHQPQDLKYKGEASELIIGDNNTIRENVTMNPGTEGGGMVTRVGNSNLIMAYAHVAHDCQLGDGIVMANCATLAGHVHVFDGAIIGGLTAVHQFVRIGAASMIGGACAVNKDVPPFCMCTGGYRAGLSGLNLVGLRRRGVKGESVSRLKRLYRILFQGSADKDERLKQAEGLLVSDAPARDLVEFVRQATRGVCMHRDEDA